MASIYQSIEILSKEKGIDLEVLTDAVKDAMVVAARKHYRTEADLVAEFNDKGAIEIYEVRQVVELVEDTDKEMTVGEAMRHDASAAVGSEIRFLRKTDSLGRISAQTAKQVILQKVREAERETVFAEFVDRVGGTDRAPVHRYRFPVQECVMRDRDLYDDQGDALGTLEVLDMHACTIDVKKRQATRDHHPPGLYGTTVYNVRTLEGGARHCRRGGRQRHRRAWPLSGRA